MENATTDAVPVEVAAVDAAPVEVVSAPSLDHLLIACFPKSGSTYLAKLLSAITGLPRGNALRSFGHRDQDICEDSLRNMTARTVIQQHIKGTAHNVALIREHGLRPIVLVRNIFDTVVSLDDHLRVEHPHVPTGYVHREYAELSFDDRIDYLIRVHLPWYFNFFASWREASSGLETFPLTYERLFTETPQTTADILRFYRLTATDEQIVAGIDEMRNTPTRFNKGLVGRGAELLTQSHKESIRQLAACWRLGDSAMASIGL